MLSMQTRESYIMVLYDSPRRVARTVWRGVRSGGPGCPPVGVERSENFRYFLLKIDHSETSEFMILGSLHRWNVCARLSERQIKTIGHCEQKRLQ